MQNNELTTTPFSQYERMCALTQILDCADRIGHEAILGLSLRELVLSGLRYHIEQDMIAFEIDGKRYKFPPTILKPDYHQEPIDYPEKTEEVQEFTTQDPINTSFDFDFVVSDSPLYDEPVSIESEPFSFMEEEEMSNVVSHTVPPSGKEDPFAFLDNTSTPASEPFSRPDIGLDALLDEFLNETADHKSSEPSNPDKTEESAAVDPTPVVTPSEPSSPALSPSEFSPSEKSPLDRYDELEAELEQILDFGRESAAGKAIKRAKMEKEQEVDLSQAQKGFDPPLSTVFVPNYDIHSNDCVYSMFIGELYEETDIKKRKIYFMVAPFEIKQNEASSNILMYAYYKDKSYAITSLNNKDKNSLLCDIAGFQFLIRGKFQDGVWSSSVHLAGNSLNRKDILTIEKEHHNNPVSIGKTNGHIRFTYQGYINRKELISTGCVNIFPMDASLQSFVVVRCMEDFIDIFYTDEVPEVDLHTREGDKRLSVQVEQGRLVAKITDAVVKEEGLFHE